MTPRFLLTWLIFVCLMGTGAAASAQTAQHAKTTLPSAAPKPPVQKLDLPAMNTRAEALMHQLEMTGMAMAIVEDGEIVFAKGYGETLRDSGQLVTEDTVFRWASVSKSVAANTVLSLVEDGKFNLSAPVTELAPSLKLPPSDTQVSILDLLSHRIGIVRNAYDRRIEADRPAKMLRSDLGELGYICPPGTCHTYQNVAFDAASEIVETVERLPYKTVVQSRVFDPLGMDTASMTREGLMRSKSWARPHGRYGKRINRIKPGYYRVPAAAGVNSSVKDMAKWMAAHMDHAETLPDMRRDAMQTPLIHTTGEQRFLNRSYGDLRQAHYGLGWRVYDYHGRKVVGHRGGVEGYRALVLFDPEAKAGIAVMWNSPHSRPIGLQMEFLDQLYGLPRRDWLRLKSKN